MARAPEPARPRDLAEFHDDLKATLAARREIDPAMEDTLIANFLQQVERRIDARVDARVAEVTKARAKRGGQNTGIVAASLALSIPLLAIAGGIAGSTGIAFVMVMVIIVNLIGFARG